MTTTMPELTAEREAMVDRQLKRRGITNPLILDAFRARPFQIDASEQSAQTCSIGWAAFPWYEDDIHSLSYEGVLKYADRALYRAKKAGKNQAVGMIHSEEGANPVTLSDSLSESLIRSANLDRDELLESPK